MTDVWADDDDPADSHHPDTTHAHGPIERYALGRDWEKLREQHVAAGYRDAIEVGKEHTLQAGFNVGYEEAIRVAFEIGKMQGVIKTLSTFLSQEHPSLLPLAPEISSLSATLASLTTFDALSGAPTGQMGGETAENVEAAVGITQGGAADPHERVEETLSRQREAAVARVEELKERAGKVVGSLGWDKEVVLGGVN
ncbi:hypothetical protein HDU93_009568 [Gonapodya sp. JEL0774]|nr:hypothetical protein HDU93_009568 [Gonapodya sp. JEL0774]